MRWFIHYHSARILLSDLPGFIRRPFFLLWWWTANSDRGEDPPSRG